MAQWWVSTVVWIVGNMFIWLIIPVYLAASWAGSNTDGVLMGCYADVRPVISKIFNIAMALFFAVSCSYNLRLKRRSGS